jgi:hypothetical protein
MINPHNPITEPASHRHWKDRQQQTALERASRPPKTLPNDELDSLPKIIKAIQEKQISYGENKTYCFFLDEDGNLTFLKRQPDEERDKDFEEEDLKQWPLNEMDGEALYSVYCGSHRGTDITGVLLNIMGINYNGC